eukprot:TRINITY_DN42249_c0_g1_i1.p1 TRINITY_DN42249_c0_g1~~TRINITY_DN42249_c0_g1_i1.p1  ORF type:complete len:454 (+),score=56.90 TRINITY_DN42249_c0_g1_i1:17-1378(+)
MFSLHGASLLVLLASFFACVYPQPVITEPLPNATLLHNDTRVSRCEQWPLCPCSPTPRGRFPNIQFIVMTSGATTHRTQNNCWMSLVERVLLVSDSFNSTGNRQLVFPGSKISQRLPLALLWQAHNLPEEVQWVFVCDDDTYVFLDNLAEMLKRFAPVTKKWYIGAASESRVYNMIFGEMAFGGAGIILSRPLLQATAPYLPVCAERKYVPGYHPSKEAVHRVSDKRLHWCLQRKVGRSLVHNMHQMDIRGDARGLIEGVVSLSRVVTLHHLEAVYLLPLSLYSSSNFAWLHSAALTGRQRLLFRRAVVPFPLAPSNLLLDISFDYTIKIVPRPYKRTAVELTFEIWMGRPISSLEQSPFEFKIRAPDRPCSRLLYYRMPPHDAGALYKLDPSLAYCKEFWYGLAQWNKPPQSLQLIPGYCVTTAVCLPSNKSEVPGVVDLVVDLAKFSLSRS